MKVQDSGLRGGRQPPAQQLCLSWWRPGLCDDEQEGGGTQSRSPAIAQWGG